MILKQCTKNITKHWTVVFESMGLSPKSLAAQHDHRWIEGYPDNYGYQNEIVTICYHSFYHDLSQAKHPTYGPSIHITLVNLINSHSAHLLQEIPPTLPETP